MSFTSTTFLYFVTLVLAAGMITPPRFRWVVLLLASYAFYLTWQPAAVVFLLAQSLATYAATLLISRAQTRPRRSLGLLVGLLPTLGMLIFVKYFNFLNDSFRHAFESIGLAYRIPALSLLMPLGLSFFTFAHVGYVVDVWKGRVVADRHLGRVALYGSFFPQIVSGPIPRAGQLLPQLAAPATLDEERLTSGLATILWGLFKKLVIADRLALYVNPVYAAPTAYNGPTLLLATYFFAFQIYCDFSGYTDIAIGVARLLGLDLIENFRQPYFAKSVAEFWHRWHISLSTWFRDYVYIPMGGSRVRPGRWGLNIMVVFLVSGLWHGANWTFLIWGGLHGLYTIVGRVTSGPRDALWKSTRLHAIRPLVATMVTFHLVLIAWVFFRAAGPGDAAVILTRWFTHWQGRPWQGDSQLTTFISVIAVALLLSGEYLLQRRPKIAPDEAPFRWPVGVRWATYIALFVSIAVLGVSSSGFIYGKF